MSSPKLLKLRVEDIRGQCKVSDSVVAKGVEILNALPSKGDPTTALVTRCANSVWAVLRGETALEGDDALISELERAKNELKSV